MNGAGQEVIRESKSGSCVNSGDCEGLANAFLDYIHNPQKYENSGENARIYFKQHFTEEVHFAELMKQLSTLIKNHKRQD
jgi:glycosyltransferase involved in cell wall biosynthesis